MEQILILIVMFILSSLFKGKNKKEAPQKGQPKPFTAGAKQSRQEDERNVERYG